MGIVLDMDGCQRRVCAGRGLGWVEAMRGFTASGEPIQGRRFIIHQAGVGLPDDQLEVRVVGKVRGQGGLVGVFLETTDGKERTYLPWPIEASDGAAPIRFEAAP